MRIADSALKASLGDTIATAVTHLLASRTDQGHWGDVRSTSLAAWALRDLSASLPPSGSSQRCRVVVRDALTWLAGQARHEEGGLSWESEGWDTSLAIIALSGADLSQDRVDQAAAWLKRICSDRGVWYDEIWESTLCAVALIYAEKAKKGPKRHLAPTLRPIINWLLDIPSKKSGEFVNPHYSGFIAWLYSETIAHGFSDSLRQEPEFLQFEKKVQAAAQWLLGLPVVNPPSLWSDATFSNAYITYALTRASEYLGLEPTYVPAAIHWFSAKRGGHGGFEDTEDTALAILGMSAIAQRFKWDLERHLNPVFPPDAARTDPARSTAGIVFLVHGRNLVIRDQIHLFLSEELGLPVRVMSAEAQAGRALAEKFEEIASQCSFAVFLLTADDECRFPDGTTLHRARQNVILEIGYFWGALGRRNKVALLVDPAIDMPSDIEGVGWIELTSDLGETRLRLRKELEQAGLLHGGRARA